tara:strand:- start:109 stop:327 length:219 start_codon:yes stop_codon:yes gene_type:complete
MGDKILKQLSVGDTVEYKHLGYKYRGTISKITPNSIGAPNVYMKTSGYSEKPLGAATIKHSEYFQVNGRNVK